MLAGYLLYTVRGVFPPFILAGFLSYVLEHPVSLAQRRGIPRARAILLVYGILLLALVLFVVYFIPAFVRDIRGLAGQVPALISMVQQYSATVRDTVIRYNLPAGLERGVIKALQRAEAFLAGIGDNVLSYFLSSATVLSYIVVAPVIAYHILKDINRWRQRALVSLAKYQLPYVDLLRDVDQVLTGFVRGQAIVASVVGGSIWIGMTVLGVKFAAALGLLAGIGEFIPFFGPIGAGIPVVVLSFMKSPATGFWGLVLLLTVQWVDANLIVPRVTGPRVGLHPIWMLFSLLAGGELLGFWGLFLAIPAAGIIGALIKFARAMYSRI
ncbi:MAG: AI-2E family transporter [Bacillota bacterium]